MSSPDPQTQLPPLTTPQGSLSAPPRDCLVSQIVTVLTAAALLLCGWLLFVLFAVGPTLGLWWPTPTPQPLPQPAPTPTPYVNDVERSDKYASQEQLVLLRMQRTEFESRTAALMTNVVTVEQRIHHWERRIQSLLHSDEGRRLGSSARQIRFLLSQVPLTATDLQQLRASIAKVRETFAQAASPLTDLKTSDDQLDAVENRLRSATTKFDVLESALNELLSDSPPAPNGLTLGEALAALETQAEAGIRQAASEKAKEVKGRHDREIGAAQDQRDSLRGRRDVAESDLRRIEIESQQQLKESENQRKEQLRELELKRQAARKQMEEALPEFRDRLSPFISAGHRQLGSFNNAETVVDAVPISYSALLRLGALNDEIKGLELLLTLGGSDPVRSMNDRPAGAFPKYTSEFDIKKPEIIRELKAIQGFLRQHGEAMVDAKLLAP